MAFPNTDMLFVDIDNKLNSNFILFLMSPFYCLTASLLTSSLSAKLAGGFGF